MQKNVINLEITTKKEPVDKVIEEKLNNCVQWLKELTPIQKNPGLLKDLSDLAVKGNLGFFKQWVLEQFGPRLVNIHRNNFLEATKDLMNQYKLFIPDFTPDEIDKFSRYMECFVFLCNHK